MRLSRVVCALLLASLPVATASAEDSRAFEIDHLQLAITSAEFLGVEGAGPMRDFSWQAHATWRYSSGALLGDMPEGGTRVLVGTRNLVDVGGGVTLWRRWGLGVSLPVLLSQVGEQAGMGSAVGDLRIVGRVNAFESHGVGGAVLLAVRAPTGNAARFLGGAGPVIEPRVALEWSGHLARAALNLGVRLRDQMTYGDLSVGNELFGAAAVGVRPVGWLDLFGELHADTALGARAFARPVTPVELLGGAAVSWRGLAVRAAVGFGVVEGYGSPHIRMLAGVSYSPPAPPPPPPPTPAPPPIAKKPAPPPPPAKPAEDEEEDEDEDEEEEEEEPAPAPPIVDDKDVRVNADFVVLADPVYFDKDKARIRSRFHKELAHLATAINARDWIKVLWIEGHTDNTGPEKWNRHLSELRAARVGKFLVAQGVAPDRVRTLASGQTKPWFSNRQKEGRDKNRRVTFFIERDEEKTPPTVERIGASSEPRPRKKKHAAPAPAEAPTKVAKEVRVEMSLEEPALAATEPPDEPVKDAAADAAPPAPAGEAAPPAPSPPPHAPPSSHAGVEP